MIKLCVICGRPFETRPSSNKITCGKACSAVRKSQVYARHKIRPKQTHGNLTVVANSGRRAHGCILWLCQCDCGRTTFVRSDNLLSGDVRSCGCLHDIAAADNIFNARLSNLRDGTNVGAIRSDRPPAHNTSGIRGVNWHKKTKKWAARIHFKGKHISLGYFDNLADAAAARKVAEDKYFKSFLDEIDKKTE